jgi:hypothetical protein
MIQNLDFGRQPTNRQRPTNWQLRTLDYSIGFLDSVKNAGFFAFFLQNPNGAVGHGVWKSVLCPKGPISVQPL